MLYKVVSRTGLIADGEADFSKIDAEFIEFPITTIVFDPYVSAAIIQQLGAGLANFDKILVESDYISLHAPLTNETRHLFGLEQFRKRSSSSFTSSQYL